jgi:hypothetical protein
MLMYVLVLALVLVVGAALFGALLWALARREDSTWR